MLAINLDAVFHLSQAAARRFVAQGSGKIINVASMLSFQGGVLVPGYTASKHAVAGLTKAFANELAAHGVNVNAIAPGLHGDRQHRADPCRRGPPEGDPGPHPGRPLGHARRTCRGRSCSWPRAASNYLNGAIIPVDGGWLVR